MSDKVYTISEERYIELLRAASTLYALEAGGVDNWGWYGDSLRVGLDFLYNHAFDKKDIEKYMKDNDIEEAYDLDFEDYAKIELSLMD